MSESTALVAVAGGAAYVRYAEALMDSASVFFHPTEHVDYVILSGDEGWPIGTECRHGIFADWLAEHDCDYAFLVDADMRFAATVGGADVLPFPDGITATLHPGYVNQSRAIYPYETRLDSTAYVRADMGDAYYCGGFIGGSRREMLALSRQVAAMIKEDRAAGIEILWHDESCVNHLLAYAPPAQVLDPRFCCPANCDYYRTFWPIDYSADARLVALDKTAEERGAR